MKIHAGMDDFPWMYLVKIDQKFEVFFTIFFYNFTIFSFFFFYFFFYFFLHFYFFLRFFKNFTILFIIFSTIVIYFFTIFLMLIKNGRVKIHESKFFRKHFQTYKTPGSQFYPLAVFWCIKTYRVHVGCYLSLVVGTNTKIPSFKSQNIYGVKYRIIGVK